MEDIHSLDQYLAAGIYPFRAAALIGFAVGGLALLLTISGIYGVLSYLVTQRTKEIGIRVALGATIGTVTALVLKQSLRLASIGIDVTPARAPIQPLARLLPALRSAGVPVIWVNWGNRPDRLNLSPALLHVYNPTGLGVGLGDRLPRTGAAVLEKDSWSAAIVDELAAVPADIRVDKYRMSGFWDTPLDSILRNLGVTTLLFGGVNADQCVLHTLADANFLGYDTLMVGDCTATTSPAFCWDATVYNVKQIFGFVASSQSILDALAA